MADIDYLNEQPIAFADESPPEPAPKASPWNILVVDDDEHVHATTRIVLGSMVILGRPLRLHEARSAAEAKIILDRVPDLAVILLDVVMENEDAGLRLVEYIRNELNMQEVRIILRTGQPGHAPELQVIENYDINDYKTKQELTHNRLVTSLTAALRGYQQIRTINHSRAGLEKIVQAASSLIEIHALENFAEGILTQMAGLLQISLDGIVCVSNAGSQDDAPQDFKVVGAAGSLAPFLFHPMGQLPDRNVTSLLQTCLRQKRNIFHGGETALFLNHENEVGAIYLRTPTTLNHWDQQLLEVFAANISVGYQNLSLIQKLEHTAYYDKVTGLPNRTAYIRTLDRAAQEIQGSYIACLLDIDHFSDINDGMGQETGNLLLQAVGDRLRNRLPGCVIARVAADVFGLYGPDTMIQPAFLGTIFEQPFSIGEDQVPVTVTMGFCRALERGEPGSWLLKFATIALNRAKKNLRERHEYFKDEMEEQVRWRLEVIHKLRASFKEDRLELWYQPIVDVATGTWSGMEALIRWNDRQQGFIPPGVFIPLAEYSGLIVDIGYWVLDHACETLKMLRGPGVENLTMAINFSVPQFRSTGFVDRVRAIVDSHGIDPRRIVIEITESIVMDEPKLVIESLETLRSMGFKVAIDDFGTGFSAMSYLQDLPLDKLKIDRSFVLKLSTEAGRAIIGTIITLCKTLKLRTVAEGVETEDQDKAIRQLGCDSIQGFLYAMPMPRDQVLALLASGGKPR